MKAPALLSFNPELQRGLWLELTPTRLVVTPIIVLVLLGGLDSVIGPGSAASAATAILWLLLVLWGSRLAAQSVDDEVAGRTWDLQRLSAQTPWGLTLGKLFGGTVFAWYGAALCAIALMVVQVGDVAGKLGHAVLAGLTAQSTALFVVLLLNRFNRHVRRTHTALAQIAGILAAWQTGLLTLPVQLPTLIMHGSLTWYGYDVPGLLAAIQGASVAWLVFGSMRIVRRELGFVDGPLGWSLYTLYAVVLAAGFTPRDMDFLAAQSWSAHILPPIEMLAAQSLAWVVAASLTYLAVLGMPVSLIDLRKLSGALAAKDWRGVWRNLPVWIPSAALTAIVAMVLTVRLGASGITRTGALMPFAALGFMMRDIALIYLIRLIYRGATLPALLILFVMLYAILPFFVGHIPGGLFAPLFYPGFYPGSGGLAIAWAEAAAASAAVWRLWRTPPAPAL